MFVQVVVLGQGLMQHARRPLANARGTAGVDPTANGNDGIQLAVLDPPRDLPLAQLPSWYRSILL